jgi:hypothetical protein
MVEKFWWGSLKKKYYLEVISVGGKIILKRSLRKWGERT